MANRWWNEEECILSVDFYWEQDGSVPSPKSDEIIKLSDLLKRMNPESAREEDNYRSPDSVERHLKKINLYYHREQKPGVYSRQKASATMIQVCELFSRSPEEMHKKAESIKARLLGS